LADRDRMMNILQQAVQPFEIHEETDANH
jgi:hypothetical protein